MSSKTLYLPNTLPNAKSYAWSLSNQFMTLWHNYYELPGQGHSQTFQNEGTARGDQGWAGGLIGTQNGSSPIDLCTKCNFIWGWARGGVEFLSRGGCPTAPPSYATVPEGKSRCTLAKRAPRSTSKIPFWRSPVRFFLWTYEILVS